MEGRPPDDSDPFEWEDTPERPRRRRSEDPYETGEGDPFETGERDRYGTSESGELKRPTPRPGDPYEPSTYVPEVPETGEREPLSTGDRELLDTGERAAYDAGTADRDYDQDPFTTDEREQRRRERQRARETGKHAVTGEHRRHRDLPANVRRRQVIGLGVIVAAVLVGGYVLAFGGGGDDEGDKGPSVKQLAGQSIVAPIGERGPDKRMLRAVRKGQVGGVVLIGDLQPNDVQNFTSRLQKAARSGGNPALLVMTDQEGGFVKRVQGPPDLSPNELGEEGDATVATAEGQKTGQFLAPLGVNVDLAPLMDVTIPQTADTIKTRTFGDDPELVSEIGVAFIQGLQQGGVSATAKHFPGLGLSTINTDFRQVDIRATAADQEAALGPFQAAVDAGVDLVMMSSAVYPDSGSDLPASLSPEIVQGQLRDGLGFDGVIVTDDLEAPAIVDGRSSTEAAVGALKAGCDLLLFARSSRASRAALTGMARATKRGNLDQSLLQERYDKIVGFKASLSGG